MIYSRLSLQSLLVGMLAVQLVGCATTTSTVDEPDLRRTYDMSYDAVYSDAVNAVALLSWELTHSEKDAGIIQANTPRNLLTDGDAVTIRIVEEESGQVLVDVSSGTKQAIDWGKNKRNITNFYEELDKLTAARTGGGSK